MKYKNKSKNDFLSWYLPCIWKTRVVISTTNEKIVKLLWKLSKLKLLWKLIKLKLLWKLIKLKWKSVKTLHKFILMWLLTITIKEQRAPLAALLIWVVLPLLSQPETGYLSKCKHWTHLFFLSRDVPGKECCVKMSPGSRERRPLLFFPLNVPWLYLSLRLHLSGLLHPVSYKAASSLGRGQHRDSWSVLWIFLCVTVVRV